MRVFLKACLIVVGCVAVSTASAQMIPKKIQRVALSHSDLRGRPQIDGFKRTGILPVSGKQRIGTWWTITLLRRSGPAWMTQQMEIMSSGKFLWKSITGPLPN